MTKQEEIREVLNHWADDGCMYPGRDCEHRGGEYCIIAERAYECLMKRLDKIGVVIKVDKVHNLEGMPVISSASCLKLSNLLGHPIGVIAQIYAEAQLDLLRAGYVATEPLIKEAPNDLER